MLSGPKARWKHVAEYRVHTISVGESTLLINQCRSKRGRLKLSRPNKNGTLFNSSVLLLLLAFTVLIPNSVQHQWGETIHSRSRSLNLSSHKTTFYSSRWSKIEATAVRIDLAQTSGRAPSRGWPALYGIAMRYAHYESKAWLMAGSHKQPVIKPYAVATLQGLVVNMHRNKYQMYKLRVTTGLARKV